MYQLRVVFLLPLGFLGNPWVSVSWSTFRPPYNVTSAATLLNIYSQKYWNLYESNLKKTLLQYWQHPSLFETMLSKIVFCNCDIPTFNMISFLEGRPFSTSDFSLCKRNGGRTLWSCWTTSCWSFSPDIWNHSSKVSAELKTYGSKKFRSDRSSWRLFEEVCQL